MYKIFVINVGSTSTSVSLFEDEKEEKREKISHPVRIIEKYSNIIEQIDFRENVIKKIVQKWEIKKLSAVAARGGLLKPLESGTYLINEKMISDIKEGRVQGPHISNICPILAYRIAKNYNCPAFIVDPVCVDEFEPLARVSGIPEIDRKALQHTLNIKATIRKVANELGKSISELNFVVAHIGGGISICAIKKGKIIDANNANEEGPFSPERAGGLPSYSLVKLCFSGKYDEKYLLKRIVGNGGLVAYLGTNSLKEIEEKIKNGDEKAKFYLSAMAYQIAKEIGAMATVLKGKIDAIILTGGGAYSKILVNEIQERVSFIAKLIIEPGENEMLSLAQGVLRVLKKEEKSKVYN